MKTRPLIIAFLVAAAATGVGAQTRTATTRAAPATRPTGPSEAEVMAQIADLELYAPTRSPAGTLRILGTSPFTHLLHNWAAEYRRLQPKVGFDIHPGSSDAPMAALTDGRVDFAAMSRPATPAEVAAFKAKHGYEPTVIVGGIGAVAVYVNHNNPLKSISPRQLEALYGREPKRGGTKVERWGDLGLTGAWAGLAPVRLGRPPRRADSDLFKALVLGGGEFRLDVREEPMPSSLVQGVGADPGAVGFASIAFVTPAVRVLPVEDEEGVVHPLTRDTCLAGEYPLARQLQLYVNRPPGKPLVEVVHDFAWFASSHYGQQLVAEAGVFPINRALQRENYDKLK
jgi:phosphate transport system substrate-binding protein